MSSRNGLRSGKATGTVHKTPPMAMMLQAKKNMTLSSTKHTNASIVLGILKDSLVLRNIVLRIALGN